MSDLFPARRPPRKYKLTPTRYPTEVVQARVLAYLASHGPCGLHDFGRCEGLARATVKELVDALSELVAFRHVTMWHERVLIRNEEGKPSIGRLARFALAVPSSAEGGGS